MKKNIIFITIILLLSCNKDDKFQNVVSPTQPQEEISVKGYEYITAKDTVQMSPNVIYVKNDIKDNFVSFNEESNTITYKETKATTQAKVGDILYSTGSEEHPDGYALKVKSVKKEGGNVIYEFEQSEIGDVFVKLNQNNNFEADFEKIKVYDIEKIKEKTEKNLSRRTRTMSIDFDLTDFLGSEDKRLKIETGTDGLTITYILWDRDKNYGTKDDQLVTEVKVNPEFKNFETKFEDGVFSSVGLTSFTISNELRFGFYSNDETKKNVKDFLKKVNRDLGVDAQNEFKSLIDKEVKIPIAKIPLKPFGPTDILIKPQLDLYIVMGFDIEGEFKIKTEWKSAYIAHTAIYTIGYNKFDINRIGKNKCTIEANANVSLEGKVGAGVGVNLYFPAFRSKENGHYKSSKVGISNEIFGNLKIKTQGDFNTDISEDDFKNANWWGRVDASLGVYVEPAIDVELRFFKKSKLDKSFTLPNSPFPLLEELSYTSGYYSMLENSNESFKIKNNSGNFENTSTNADVAIAQIEEDNVKIQALKNGDAIINISDKERIFKKARLVVEVKENNKPYIELLSPTPAYLYQNKGITTLSWEFHKGNYSNDITYELKLAFEREPGIFTIMTQPDIKESSFTFDMQEYFKSDYINSFYWQVIAKDAQANTITESKINTFGVKYALPVIKNSSINNITKNSARCFAEISAIGSSPITYVGFCWDTSVMPRVSDFSKEIPYNNEKEFNLKIEGLQPDTKYYLRAYARNNDGISYGEFISIKTE